VRFARPPAGDPYPQRLPLTQLPKGIPITAKAKTGKRAATLCLLASLTLGLGACGDEDEPASSSAESGQAETSGEVEPSPTKEVVIEAADGAFDSRTIYESAAPSVVTIISVFRGGTGDVLGTGGGRGQGSGFVISDEGEIVTNAHVVTDAANAGVAPGPINPAEEVYVQFPDRNQVEAEIVGFDPFADVALLEIDPDGLDIDPVPLGSENDVAVGEPVAAIGSPFGQEQSLSVGIVSATDRSIESLTQFNIEGAIQTDASINPGNSGGPLLDAAGEVVGINQQINTTSGGNEGVGFALPIDLAERSIEQLREDGEVAYAYAGVSTTALYPQLAERLDLEVETGALVREVVAGGPADKAGLRGGDSPIRFQGLNVRTGGDVITAVDGEKILGESDLPRIIALHEPGDVVSLEIIRDGETEEIEVELGERPTESP
jgi:S1-C subfamily serine protease